MSDVVGWLITDGTLGITTKAIVVDRSDDIKHAIDTMVDVHKRQRDQIVVNPILKPLSDTTLAITANQPPTPRRQRC